MSPDEKRKFLNEMLEDSEHFIQIRELVRKFHRCQIKKYQFADEVCSIVLHRITPVISTTNPQQKPLDNKP
jgi:hypothetical protein